MLSKKVANRNLKDFIPFHLIVACVCVCLCVHIPRPLYVVYMVDNQLSPQPYFFIWDSLLCNPDWPETSSIEVNPGCPVFTAQVVGFWTCGAIYYLFLILCLVYSSVYGVLISWHACGGQKTTWRSFFSYHVGSGTQSQVIRLGGNCYYLLSVNSTWFYLKIYLWWQTSLISALGR